MFASCVVAPQADHRAGWALGLSGSGEAFQGCWAYSGGREAVLDRELRPRCPRLWWLGALPGAAHPARQGQVWSPQGAEARPSSPEVP